MTLPFAAKPSVIAICGVFASLLSGAVADAAAAVRPATGHEAVASVRHDWKKDAHLTVHAKGRSLLPVPANYAHLAPEARLAFLHARRALNPIRFDHYHPSLGPLLARDDRMKAAESQNCLPMNGLLPDNSLTRYLQFRRGLNPVRFDFYHPSLGAILVEDHKLKSDVNCVGGQLIPPPIPPIAPPGTPAPGPPVGGGPPPLRAVPEPGSLALILLGSAGACLPILLRRWRARCA